MRILCSTPTGSSARSSTSSEASSKCLQRMLWSHSSTGTEPPPRSAASRRRRENAAIDERGIRAIEIAGARFGAMDATPRQKSIRFLAQNPCLSALLVELWEKHFLPVSRHHASGEKRLKVMESVVSRGGRFLKAGQPFAVLGELHRVAEKVHPQDELAPMARFRVSNVGERRQLSLSALPAPVTRPRQPGLRSRRDSRRVAHRDPEPFPSRCIP